MKVGPNFGPEFPWKITYKGHALELIGVTRTASPEMYGEYVELHVFLPELIEIQDAQRPLPQVALELDQIIKATDV